MQLSHFYLNQDLSMPISALNGENKPYENNKENSAEQAQVINTERSAIPDETGRQGSRIKKVVNSHEKLNGLHHNTILPLERHEMSGFDISGKNTDLLFPEYGIHLENKQPDMVDYAAKFEQLTPSEKESIYTWTMKPSSEEVPDSLRLNAYLRKEVKLTDELNFLDMNLSSALSKNLPQKKGDIIRFEQYFSNEKNPWLNGNLKVGDYLCDKGYLSFSGKDVLVRNVIIKNIKTQNKKLTCHVFYRVKNANNGFYLPEKIATTGKNVDEVLYGKGQVFKIKDIAIALPKNVEEACRVAVDLEEVKPDETMSVNIGNWHIGKIVKIDRPASFSLSLSDLLDSGPSVPKKRRQQ